MANKVAAHKLQVAAQEDNHALLKPMGGVTYTRVEAVAAQAEQAVDSLTTRFVSGAELIVGITAVMADLVPSTDEASVAPFEQAIADLGEILGFTTQQPERDTGTGPDGLWAAPGARILVIECKSGVKSTRKFISRTEIEQLTHSIDWFSEKYGAVGAVATPVIIHPTPILHVKAHARPGTRVMTFAQLGALRDAVRRFALAVAQDDGFRDLSKVADQLKAEGLQHEGFAERWCVAPTRD
jgi:hypothetical protein